MMEAVRRKVVDIIASDLGKSDSERKIITEEVNKISRRIERGIWNHTIKLCRNSRISLNWDDYRFKNLYRARYAEVLLNLRREHNGLSQKILNGLVNPRMVGECMTPEEMDPIRADEDRKLREKSALECVFTPSIPVGPSVAKCGKCANQGRDAYRVSTYSMQTRSGKHCLIRPFLCALFSRSF